ncbi:MAG: rhomboid family intramembrane serine protease [Planctomycetes bacterium]|nr:rhomboid family intramembrane serine protease [Planctomycetota bacterium]
MRNGPVLILRRAFCRFPATAGVILVAVLLFAAVSIFDALHPQARLGGSDFFGAVAALHYPALGLKGPLNLWGDQRWNGEWWRVLISGFHHAGPFHLLMNCAGIGFLGFLLERRMGSLRYLLFFLAGTTVSLIPCFLVEHYVVGLSGGVYALFGYLLVWQNVDEEFKETIPAGLIGAGIIGLFAGFLLNAVGWMNISNLGHVSGLIYGWIAGEVMIGRLSPRPLWKRTFLFAHLMIVPAFYLITHPTWNGRYHWFLAQQTADRSVKIQELKRAVEIEPGLSGAWRHLARVYAQAGQRQLAWKAALSAVYHQRSDRKATKIVRKIWKGFRTVDAQREALKTVAEIFGDESAEWQQHLGLGTVPKSIPISQ